MRLDEKRNTLVLSERNLITLLSKLYSEDSAATIGGAPDECPMFVRSERDAEHYGERDAGAGPMHPLTEKVLGAVREATGGMALGDDESLANAVLVPQYALKGLVSAAIEHGVNDQVGEAIAHLVLIARMQNKELV